MAKYNYGFPIEEQDRGKNFFIVTIILLAANVVMYIYSVVHPEDYYLAGGMNYTLVVEYGQRYRFFTSIFLHGDLEHIFMNMMALVMSGTLVESYLGSFRTAMIYFVSGLGGSLLSLLVHQGENQVYSIGASGAIFGLLVTVALIQCRREGKSILSALAFGVFYAVATYSDGIDITGHLGGAIAGGILSLPFTIRFREEYKEKVILKVLGIAFTLAVCLLAVVLILNL